MHMNIRKMISITVAASVLSLSVSGCFLLTVIETPKIEETAGKYIELIKKGKYNSAKLHVADEDDYFLAADPDESTVTLMNTLLDNSEYTVSVNNVTKTDASADIIFEMPDLSVIADEGYTFDEFVEAMGDIDETVEQSVEFEFSKEEDKWLIEPESTEDFYNFLTGVFEGIDFGPLNERTALEAVDTFFGLLAQGDYESAMAMSAGDQASVQQALSSLGAMGDISGISDLFAAYYSNIQYETIVTEVTDDAITVSVTGTAPDVQTAVDTALADHDIIVPVIADYIDNYVHGNNDYTGIFNSIIAIGTDAVSTAGMIPYSCDITVTADENGILRLNPGEGFIFNFSMPELDTENLGIEAVMLLIEQGRLTYADAMTLYSEGVPTPQMPF